MTSPSKNAHVTFPRRLLSNGPQLGSRCPSQRGDKQLANPDSTDPDQVSIVLVDTNVHPPVNKNIADHVQTSDGSYAIPPQSGIQNGKGYQINLVSKLPQNEGILAQSQQFTIVGKAADYSISPPSTGKTDFDSTSDLESATTTHLTVFSEPSFPTTASYTKDTTPISASTTQSPFPATFSTLTSAPGSFSALHTDTSSPSSPFGE